ncbi:hypothetical protein FPQ18DRAFT_401057 [Pyronema domesticum]|nr:hypothetical protein FPQ18DRAFT_401057 [Pyronema domesticum]
MLARSVLHSSLRTTVRQAMPVQKRFSGHVIYDPERRRWSENPDKGWLVTLVAVGGLTYGLTIGLRWADNWKTGRE